MSASKFEILNHLTKIKVSVIVPVYNMEQMIEQCLSNIKRQTLQEIEIICINDGSTDNSLEILYKCRRDDSRIKIISTPNRGSGLARNIGLNHAKGEYIAFMDADDYYPTTEVLQILYYTAIKTESEICGGSLCCVNEKNHRIKVDTAKQIFKQNGYINIYEYQWCLGYQRFIYRKALLEKNKIHFKNYRRFQDPPFMLQTMLCASSIYAIKMETYCYRTNYKQIVWTERKLADYIKGLTDVLCITNEYNLKILHKFIIKERVQDGTIEKNLKRKYKKVYIALEKLEKQINYSWLHEEKCITVEIIKKSKWIYVKQLLKMTL